jgi:hypothetical protein
MFRKSATVLLLCLAVIVSAVVFTANAEQIIEIDTEGLWGNDVLGDDSGSGNTGDNTGNNPGDNNTTYIPEDNPDTGHGSGGNGGNGSGSASVVGPKEDKEDDKTTVLPTPGANTGN